MITLSVYNLHDYLIVNLLANCHCTGMCQSVSDLSETTIYQSTSNQFDTNTWQYKWSIISSCDTNSIICAALSEVSDFADSGYDC